MQNLNFRMIPEEIEEESEHVLIDLDGVADYDWIPANAPFVLSGLDTVNPILLIDNKIKLIGEYQETIGTCLVFSENDSCEACTHTGEGPSEANLFSGVRIVDQKQSPVKDVRSVACVNKILKFNLLMEGRSEGGVESKKGSSKEGSEPQLMKIPRLD